MEQVRDGEVAGASGAHRLLLRCRSLSVGRAAAAFLPVRGRVLLRLPIWHVVQPCHGLAVLVPRFGLAVRAAADADALVVGVRARRAADPIGGPGGPGFRSGFSLDDVRHRFGQGHRHGAGIAPFPCRSAAPADGARFRAVLSHRRRAGSRRGGLSRREARVRHWGIDYWVSWQQWFLGNVLAHLVVTPAILYGIPRRREGVAAPHPKPLDRGAARRGRASATGYLAFRRARAPAVSRSRGSTRRCLSCSGRRFDSACSVRPGAVVLISVISVEAALQGRGPFAGRSPSDDRARAPAVPAAPGRAPVSRGAPDRAEAGGGGELIASERRYREVVESQTELVCRFLPDGTLSFVNEAFCRAFQREPRGLVGTDFVALLPEAAHDARARPDRAWPAATGRARRMGMPGAACRDRTSAGSIGCAIR